MVARKEKKNGGSKVRELSFQVKASVSDLTFPNVAHILISYLAIGAHDPILFQKFCLCIYVILRVILDLTIAPSKVHIKSF